MSVKMKVVCFLLVNRYGFGDATGSGTDRIEIVRNWSLSAASAGILETYRFYLRGWHG